jgi:glycosyltransferase involved in cell wall biosynthesis
MNRLQKAIGIYKNHGLKGLLQKGGHFIGVRLHRAQHGFTHTPQTLEAKNLREEYTFVSNEIFQITAGDIAASRAVIAASTPKHIRTATWFVPYYDHFGFNGIQTIFRFMQKLSQEGVRNHIVIYDNPAIDTARLRYDIASHFPDLKNYHVTVFTDDKIKGLSDLPPSDIAFCTIWVSAYLLLRFNKTKRKYYFIQDYEPLFYVAGSTYALAESTYRFGFRGIVNTPGLLAAVNQRHGLEGISFIPAANHAVFYPDPHRQPNQRTRIVFYARPLNPRNSFNLGILTIKHLLDTYGDRIEVVTAGSDGWDPAEFGLAGRITNLGLVKSLTAVADLYRTCDIGFAYMMNKHTTYQFFDYTSCGVATVMNENEDHHWLHKHEVNCLLAEPSPAAMAEQIGRLIDDPALRARLVKNATAAIGYTWDQQMERLWNDVRQF